MDRGVEIVPVEVKTGQTVSGDFFNGLKHWRTLAGTAAAAESWLLYGGTDRQERQGVLVVPWRQVGELTP